MTPYPMLLEPIELDYSALNWKEAVEVVEDYKPLDVQSATMNLALLKGIREKYPDWKYLIDGDGGDENLKDYPIEENPELTIKSVLNNLMLYHEGWGVDSIKHSLTYSGGLSRGYTRTCSPADMLGFEGFDSIDWYTRESEGDPQTLCWSIHYHVQSMSDLQAYFDTHAERMKADGARRFGGSYRANRRILSFYRHME